MDVAATIAAVALLLGAAWGFDRWRNRAVWGRKSADELNAIIAAAEWRYWQLALQEMKRRGHEASSIVPLFAGHLVSGSNMERAAARIVLMKAYPETRALLKDYRPTDEEGARRKSLEPLFARYPASR